MYRTEGELSYRILRICNTGTKWPNLLISEEWFNFEPSQIMISEYIFAITIISNEARIF